MANPIIQREFLSLVKTPKALMMQVVVAVCLSTLVLLTYPSDAISGEAGRQAQFVFRICGYGLLTVVLLIVPAFPATSVVREKASGTLALLLNSPMKPWSIYFGKFCGTSLFLLMLLAISLPALVTCYSMGGISLLTEILPLYLILLLATFFLVAIGMLVSTLNQSADAALRYTYFVTFLLAFVTLMPWFFLKGKDGIWPQVAYWLRYVSPVNAVAQLLGQGDLGSQGVMQPQHGPWLFLLVAAICSAAVIGLNIFILSRRIFDYSRSAGMVTDDRSLAVRAGRRIFFLVDPNRRKRGIGFLTNPVFIKEFRTRRLGRSHWMLRLMAACAVGSVLLTYLATSGTIEWGINAIGGIMVLLQVALILLVAPSLASGLISSELESGGWNLLMLTPLRPTNIVIGKLLSVTWTVALILLSTLPGYLVIIWIDPELKPQVYRVIITLLLASTFTISISAMISSFFRRAAVSTAVAYAVVTSLFAGSMLIWLGRDTTFGYHVVRRALLINPISSALEAFQTTGFEVYQLIPLNWWLTGAATVVCLSIFLIRTSMLMRPR